MDTRPLRYILYARRSSDRDDLQTLSLDQQVQVLRQLALSRDLDPTIRDWAFEAIAWWADGEPSPEKVVRQTKSALARAEGELATLTDLLVNGTVVPDEYRVRRVNLLARIEHLREALAKPVERLEAWRTVRDEKRKNGLHLGREFRDGDVQTKRKILARIATEVVVHEGRAAIALRAPFVRRRPFPCPQNSGDSGGDSGRRPQRASRDRTRRGGALAESSDEV